MARITIASLQAQIVTLTAERNALARERDALLVAQRPSRRAPNVHTYTPRAPSAESVAFRAKLAAAKAAAMATGTCVAVA